MAVTVADIQVLASLQDQVKGNLGNLRKGIVAAGAAIGAAGLAAGKEWDQARSTIQRGTGATGQELDGLLTSYRNLAGTVQGDVATALADLNTHLGLTGDELEDVATAALRAKIDTNSFGGAVRSMGLDATDARLLLDQLIVASQDTGVSVDQITQSVARYNARFIAAGGTTRELIGAVVDAADKFGPHGMRGAMTELLEEMEKEDGVIPSFRTLEQVVGDNAQGAADALPKYDSLLQRLGGLKDRAAALIGPMGNVIGVLGSMGALITGLIPMMGPMTTAAKAMWAAIGGPPVWIATAVVALGTAFFVFRRQVGNVLSSVIEFVATWASNFVTILGNAIAWIPGIGPKVQTAIQTVQGALDNAIGSVAAWVDDWGEAETAQTDAGTGMDDLGVKTDDLGVKTETNAEKVEKVANALTRAKDEATDAAIELDSLQATWDDMTPEEQADSIDIYRDALRDAKDKGVELTGAQEVLILQEPTLSMAMTTTKGHVTLLKDELTATHTATSDLGTPTLWQKIKDAASGLKDVALDLGKQFVDEFARIKQEGGSTFDALKAGAGVAFDGIVQSAITAIPGIGGALAGLAPMVSGALKSVGSTIGGWFGFGKSEAEKAAEEMAAAQKAAAQAAYDAWKKVYDDLMGEHKSWKENFAGNEAELVQALKRYADTLGLGFAEARKKYGEYRDALADQDEELIGQLRATFEEWKSIVDGAFDAAISAWDQAKKAGADAAQSVFDAHDEALAAAKAAVEDAKAALDALKDDELATAEEIATAHATLRDAKIEAATLASVSQAELAQQAAEAEKAAIDDVLAKEGEKHVRQAAFEAALHAIRTGNAEGAAAAAATAAAQTQSAWTVALEAVQDADAIAMETMSESKDEPVQAWQIAGEKIETVAGEIKEDLGGVVDVTDTIATSMDSIGNAADEAKTATQSLATEIVNMPTAPPAVTPGLAGDAGPAVTAPVGSDDWKRQMALAIYGPTGFGPGAGVTEAGTPGGRTGDVILDGEKVGEVVTDLVAENLRDRGFAANF